MGLRDEITADIAAAFDSDLADAIQSFRGMRYELFGPYDPITQQQTKVETPYEGRGVFGGYSDSVIDGIQILKTDVKLTALQAEVTDIPMIDDFINDMKVITVGKDPAGVTWEIQLRRS